MHRHLILLIYHCIDASTPSHVTGDLVDHHLLGSGNKKKFIRRTFLFNQEPKTRRTCSFIFLLTR